MIQFKKKKIEGGEINPIVVLLQGKVSVQFWKAAIWYSLPVFTGHQNYCLSSDVYLRPSSYLSLKINDSQKFNFGYMFTNNRISSHFSQIVYVKLRRIQKHAEVLKKPPKPKLLCRKPRKMQLCMCVLVMEEGCDPSL